MNYIEEQKDHKFVLAHDAISSKVCHIMKEKTIQIIRLYENVNATNNSRL